MRAVARAAWLGLHVGELLMVGEGFPTVHGVRATAARTVTAVGANGERKMGNECGEEARGEGGHFLYAREGAGNRRQGVRRDGCRRRERAGVSGSWGRKG